VATHGRKFTIAAALGMLIMPATKHDPEKWQRERKQMNKKQTRREFGAAVLATAAASILPAPFVWAAEKKYDAGASDTEIKLGQTVPHSGPGSIYGVLGRIGEAYFQMLNEKGGINGRKITFFTMDDAYSPPKCVEATRRLVEQEEVLALFGSLGTAPQTAVHKYLNSRGVPQLLLNTGASKWNDPKNNKWTMAGLPLYPTEARILAKHVVATKPNAKVGILYQNDDFGRDFLAPFKKVLADAGGTAQVIMEQTYDLTEPTIDSQLINLSKSGADVFYNITTGKAASQSIRRVVELGWKPLQLLSAGSTGLSILRAAGLENAKDIVAIRYSKEAGPGRWEKDKDVMAFEALRAKYLPTVDPDNTIAYAGYGQAVSMGEILRRCGDDLTRANVLKQASTLAGYHSPFFLDDINYSYTPDDYSPMKTLHISIFDGKEWQISEKAVSE
jgi:ABC-type branched-subunit amino acid transport system substrate-binding protein